MSTGKWEAGKQGSWRVIRRSLARVAEGPRRSPVAGWLGKPRRKFPRACWGALGRIPPGFTPRTVTALEAASCPMLTLARSPIHGRGLFCKRNIDAGEMVIEYAGNVIRSILTDKREKYYDGKVSPGRPASLAGRGRLQGRRAAAAQGRSVAGPPRCRHPDNLRTSPWTA